MHDVQRETRKAADNKAAALRIHCYVGVMVRNVNCVVCGLGKCSIVVMVER